MSSQNVSRYHPLLVALHWTLAVLIIADLTIGAVVLVHIPNDAPKKIEGLRAHMSGGILILTLMLARLALRVGSAKPAEASTGSAFLNRMAWFSHRLLYLAVLAMALSGLAMGLEAHLPEIVFLGRGKLPESFWIYPLRSVHYFLSRLLIALVALHIAGALYHVFIRRDHLLRRMAFGARHIDTRLAPARTAVVDGRSARPWFEAPWLSQLILAAPALLFIRIGWKYVSDPLQVAAGSGMILGSPAAITDTRAVGAIFLAFAIVALVSVLSARRVLAGLVLVTTVIGFVTAARVLGVVIDGATPETVFKLVPELVLLTLSSAGILLERRRRVRLESTARQSAFVPAE